MEKVAMPLAKLPPPILIKDGQFFMDRAIISFPAIITKMLEFIRKEKQFTPEMIKSIEELLLTMPYKQVPDHSKNNKFEDSIYWEQYLSNLENKNWLDIDFLFAETYIYREINIILRNLLPTELQNQEDHQIIDPFQDQKEFALKSLPKKMIEFLLNKEEKLIKEEMTSSNLEKMLLGSISGNLADLCKWPELNFSNENINYEPEIKFAVNELSKIMPYILSLKTQDAFTLCYFLDNVGIELLSDLCLLDYLLNLFKQAKIIVYMKPLPLFVSDVTFTDFNFTLKYLNDYSPQLVSRINNYQKNSRLIIKSNLFLTTPLSFCKAPKEILNDIQEAELTFFKGVFNYLKIIGNNNWEKNTPFKDVINYFNAKIVALNVAKQPVAVGLNFEEIPKFFIRISFIVFRQIQSDEFEWLCSGEWALVQTNI